MPLFRFQAMDSAGDVRKDHVEAATADDARRLLAARGLFVTRLIALSSGAGEASAHGQSAKATQDAPSGRDSNVTGMARPARGLAVCVTAIGLACVALGLYGVLDSIWFGIGATRTTATVIGAVGSGVESSDVLEFTASDGRSHRVEARGAWRVHWAPSHVPNGHVPILFHADSPEKARLADFAPRFAVPLILLVLGCLFTPVGLLVWRGGLIPA